MVHPMPEWVARAPLWVGIGFLFFVVFFRAQATFWIGRGLAAGTIQAGKRSGAVAWVARGITSPRFVRAEQLVHRYGGPVITGSFLTIGFQTFANTAAGFMRMSWPRYTVWMVPGCVAWALIYGFGGLAVWAAIGALLTGSPLVLGCLVVATGAVIGLLVYRRHRHSVDLAAHTHQ